MSSILSALTFPPLDAVLFRLGPLSVRWYGLAYLLGFALTYTLLKRMVRSRRLRIAPEHLSDLMTWLMVGVLVGGRLGWWVFYHRGEAAAEPWYAPLAVWQGGMSFHGGLVGVAASLVAWTYLRNAPFANVADALALVAPLGLFFGRIANFINAELVGRPTGLPWGVIFPGESFARHPSQLYEALLEGPVLMAALWWFARAGRRRSGHVAAAFLVLYGSLRFLGEFTRQPDEQLGFIAFGWLTLGQLFSAGQVLAGLALAGVFTTSRSSPRPRQQSCGRGRTDGYPSIGNPSMWGSHAGEPTRAGGSAMTTPRQISARSTTRFRKSLSGLNRFLRADR